MNTFHSFYLTVDGKTSFYLPDNDIADSFFLQYDANNTYKYTYFEAFKAEDKKHFIIIFCIISKSAFMWLC